MTEAATSHHKASTDYQIVRYQLGTEPPAVGLLAGGALYRPAEGEPVLVSSLLERHLSEIRAWAEGVLADRVRVRGTWSLLAPVDGDTEVWGAGVTYKRSEEARAEESVTPDLYTRVYQAERPELFFKANARRVAGPDEPVVIRQDSTWDVPEPELAVVVTCYGEIMGYAVADDVSSRSIEGENALYLPQAKVYAHCCGVGPGIAPAWQVADPYQLRICLEIRRAGQAAWRGETSTRALRRRLDELVAYLFREDSFPGGVVLSTGTGIVPEEGFTLQQGDVVEIVISRVGRLRNPVVRGKARLAVASGALSARS